MVVWVVSVTSQRFQRSLIFFEKGWSSVGATLVINLRYNTYFFKNLIKSIKISALIWF